MLNLTSGDLVTFTGVMHHLEEIVRTSGDWIPTIIMVQGDEKVVISYGESGDPCITEAYDVHDELERRGVIKRP